jgi:ankyrin repeat protein
VRNARGSTPIDTAAAAQRGEVLNALLLGCAHDGRSTVAVAAMRALLGAGAVPDTWAPNGSSALMLAAAADGVAALEVLLGGGASLELQDALGR